MRESRRACLAMLALAGSGYIRKAVSAENTKNVIDFSDPDAARQMRIVNDDVMGGRSGSRIVADSQGLIFSGVISLENNGGFASARCSAQFPQQVSILELSVRGDGKRYQFILRTELSTLAPLYKCGFVASADWTTHQFHVQDFDASIRGRTVAAAPLVFGDVRELGVLIADRQAGEFRLQIRSIRAR